MKLIIAKTIINDERGIVSELQLENTNLFILERPFINNFVNISSIYRDDYMCKFVPLNSNVSRFDYEHFNVLDVDDRTAIAIHRGNCIDDSEGCLLIGTSLYFEGEELRIANSTDALASLVSEVGRQDFVLRLED